MNIFYFIYILLVIYMFYYFINILKYKLSTVYKNSYNFYNISYWLL